MKWKDLASIADRYGAGLSELQYLQLVEEDYIDTKGIELPFYGTDDSTQLFCRDADTNMARGSEMDTEDLVDSIVDDGLSNVARGAPVAWCEGPVKNANGEARARSFSFDSL